LYRGDALQCLPERSEPKRSEDESLEATN
jgi:hypothetical protein